MPPPTAIDLYAGAGGATQGLTQAGFLVIGAVENDQDAVATYRANHPNVRLWPDDIRRVTATGMLRSTGLRGGRLTLLKACPPCQGFSALAEGRAEVDERRNDLVRDVVRFMRAFRPDALLLENVPGLGRDERFAHVTRSLDALGYRHRSYQLDAGELGVPQRRRRLILFAVRGRRGALPAAFTDLLPDHFDTTSLTAGEALRRLAVGRVASDALDRHRTSRADVRERIRAVPVNGSRFDLPADLQLPCHRALDGRGHRVATASYGRVRADDLAPTMTTRCTTPACGSFVHPTEHRGLTLREAATFQTFPYDYRFIGGYDSIERQIGNAVPVRMAEALGHAALTALGHRARTRQGG